MRNAAILALLAACMGGVLAFWAGAKERRSIPKWSFVGGMICLMLESIFAALAAHSDQGSEVIRGWEQGRLAAMAALPGTWLLFSLTYARGNGREFLFKWRWLLGVVSVFPLVVAGCFYRDLIRVDVSALEPDVRLLHLTMPGQALCISFLVSMILILTNLERTFRASVGTMRWRIKFVIVGLGVLFAVRAYTVVETLLLHRHGIEESFFEVDSAGLLIAGALVMRAFLRGPMEVEVYPTFAILQNSIIVLLAGVYLLIVGVFAKVVEWLGGDVSFKSKVFLILVSLVGLTILGLSERVRLHTRRFFSRYLQRPLYDYRTVWRSFTEAIASRVKQDELCEAAVKQVAEIFQALSVTIWLVDDKMEKLELAASTSLSPAKGAELGPTKEESQSIMRAVQNQAEPQEIESGKEEWMVALRRGHPAQFRAGGSRVCVPMMAGPQLMGVMTLGDRVGGIFFSLQDFDLLKCLGDQVAAGLLNAQLSQKLLQNKELEAFQTMSAFFVHDLKNTASTLNLMLKNLPVHFDNPAFREDALRGVAKTCDHINHLITRLSLLRHELHIKPVEMDFNEVITRVLNAWNGATGATLVKNLQPCPKILLDQEQIHKVVTNLVLNATEAVPKGGQIAVESSQANGWVVLSVADNGCGMDPEFMRRALFRPFQTTKKNGFGIGMFQSKMIVEAHGGRIEVESELKKGTTFRVLLPVPKNLK